MKKSITVKFEIPTTLKDVTVSQYQEFVGIKDPDDIDFLRCFVKGYSDKYLTSMKKKDYDSIVTEVSELFSEEYSHSRTFWHKGIEFGFIPKLDDMTYGENMDISKYISDWSSMNKALSVMYRPVVKRIGYKYLIKDYVGTHEYCELMKNVPVTIALGAIVFFWTLTKDLLRAIPNYLETELNKSIPKYHPSRLSGEVTSNTIRSLKGTFEDLMRFPI